MNDPVKVIWKFKNNNRRVQYLTYVFIGDISNDIKNYKFYKQDINNQDVIKRILNKYNPSLIFNVAAETHVDRSIDGPKQFIDSNIYGVFNNKDDTYYSQKNKLGKNKTAQPVHFVPSSTTTETANEERKGDNKT